MPSKPQPKDKTTTEKETCRFCGEEQPLGKMRPIVVYLPSMDGHLYSMPKVHLCLPCEQDYLAQDGVFSTQCDSDEPGAEERALQQVQNQWAQDVARRIMESRKRR